MLRILLYLQYIQKQYYIFNSTHKILIKSQVILHRHTQNLLMIYTRMNFSYTELKYIMPNVMLS